MTVISTHITTDSTANMTINIANKTGTSMKNTSNKSSQVKSFFESFYKKKGTLIQKAVPLLTGMSVLLLSANSAHAQTHDSEKKDIRVGINVTTSNTPYALDDTEVTVLPSVFFDNDKVYARGTQFGGYLAKDEKNEITAYLAPAGFDFKPDDASGALKGLDKRQWSGMAGLRYQRRIPYAALRGEVATDILDNSGGTIAKLSVATRYKTGNLTVYPSAGLQWSNDTYNDYYFGVSDKESLKTGINTYTAKSSVNPYITINANYDINQDWALFFSQNVTHLSDEQADSPMVDNDLTYRTTLGVLYTF